jgi:hypothetical protein
MTNGHVDSGLRAKFPAAAGIMPKTPPSLHLDPVAVRELVNDHAKAVPPLLVLR